MGAGRDRRERRRRAEMKAMARFFSRDAEGKAADGEKEMVEWRVARAERAIRHAAGKIKYEVKPDETVMTLCERTEADIAAVAGPVAAAGWAETLTTWGEGKREQIKQWCHRPR